MSEIRIVEALKRLQDEFKELSKQPGPRGERGLTGPQGERGKDGLNGRDGVDGRDGRDGIDGKDGKDGKDGISIRGEQGPKGKDGKDGLGIKKCEIREDHLFIILTNGREFDCGNVRGYPGASGYAVSILDVEIRDNHLYVRLTDGTEIDAGYIGGGGGAVASVNGKVGEVILTYEDVGASALLHTHNYEDLQNLPTIPTVPENVSAFNNDAGYLTEHQSLDGYATEEWVEGKGYLTEHQSLEGYATETWVGQQGYLTEHQSLSNYYNKSETYSKSEVNNLITFVVHLQDTVGGGLQADYTFAQILAAINRMQWVILKYQEQTYTVYERDNSHILWQSTRYYSSTLTTKLFNLTSADVWSKESQTLSLNDIKPIVVHITKEGSTVTADYTFDQLIGAVSDQVIECCYNGNHVPMGTHTSQKITFTADDVDMDTGITTEIVIEVDNTNTWRMVEDQYIPLKQDKLLYDYAGGLHVDGTLNSSYIDENGMLITTGSSGEWDAWNITDMNLNEFKIIRFVCYRDASNTGGTWVCDVPLLTPIQIHDNVGFFVSSGAMNSFGDRNRWNVAQCGVRWNNGNKDAISIGQVFSLYGTAATTVSGIKICAVYGVY